MGIAIDIVGVLIFVITIIFGYKRGLVGVAYKLVSFIVALILTLILINPVSNLLINNTNIDETVYNNIIDNIGNKNDIQVTKVEYLDNYINQMKTDSAEIIATQISTNVVKAIAAVCLYIAIRIILLLFYKFSELLAELPIVKQFNKAGGVIYGILEAIVIVFLIIYVTVIISTVTGNIGIINTLGDSMLGRIVMNFIGK